MTRDYALKVALGAGLDDDQANLLLDDAPLNLMRKLGIQRQER